LLLKIFFKIWAKRKIWAKFLSCVIKLEITESNSFSTCIIMKCILQSFFFHIILSLTLSFHTQVNTRVLNISRNRILTPSTFKSSLKMNFFEDAFRFFSNLNKEASAKHILMKGPGKDL
jgi:hypothetical protein